MLPESVAVTVKEYLKTQVIDTFVLAVVLRDVK